MAVVQLRAVQASQYLLILASQLLGLQHHATGASFPGILAT